MSKTPDYVFDFTPFEYHTHSIKVRWGKDEAMANCGKPGSGMFYDAARKMHYHSLVDAIYHATGEFTLSGTHAGTLNVANKSLSDWKAQMQKVAEITRANGYVYTVTFDSLTDRESLVSYEVTKVGPPTRETGMVSCDFKDVYADVSWVPSSWANVQSWTSTGSTVTVGSSEKGETEMAKSVYQVFFVEMDGEGDEAEALGLYLPAPEYVIACTREDCLKKVYTDPRYADFPWDKIKVHAKNLFSV